jgi:hypothetical protein
MRKHGESSYNLTKEYATWSRIRNKCNCPSDKAYPDYGGRGIKICDRWLESYENFLADMGRAPSTKHSIDRINNDGNYEPANCRWATVMQQVLNRRNTLRYTLYGRDQTLVEWCQELNVNYRRALTRVRRLNWPIEKALSDVDFRTASINQK